MRNTTKSPKDRYGSMASANFAELEPRDDARRATFFEVIEQLHRVLDADPDAKPRYEDTR